MSGASACGGACGACGDMGPINALAAATLTKSNELAPPFVTLVYWESRSVRACLAHNQSEHGWACAGNMPRRAQQTCRACSVRAGNVSCSVQNVSGGCSEHVRWEHVRNTVARKNSRMYVRRPGHGCGDLSSSLIACKMVAGSAALVSAFTLAPVC